MKERDLSSFARTLVHLLESERALEAPAVDAYRELVSLCCRKIDTIAPLNVSKKAKALADEEGIENLRSHNWHSTVIRRLHEPGGKRRLLVLEHVVTVHDLERDIRALHTITEEGVLAILASARIAWIHRSEDDELNRARARKTRRDADRIYTAAGIEFVHPWDECKSPPARLRRRKRSGHSRVGRVQ